MRSYLPLFIRVGVAALLISYGMEKLSDPVSFLKSIHEYDILPVKPSWILNLGRTSYRSWNLPLACAS